MRERRRDRRHSLSGSAFIALGDVTGEFPLLDVSASGCGVLMEQGRMAALPNGEIGTCLLESPDLACLVNAYISVMRIRPSGGAWHVGLRFESISDEQLRVIRAYESLSKARRGHVRVQAASA